MHLLTGGVSLKPRLRRGSFLPFQSRIRRRGPICFDYFRYTRAHPSYDWPSATPGWGGYRVRACLHPSRRDTDYRDFGEPGTKPGAGCLRWRGGHFPGLALLRDPHNRGINSGHDTEVRAGLGLGLGAVPEDFSDSRYPLTALGLCTIIPEILADRCIHDIAAWQCGSYIRLLLGSSMVEHPAVNRRVAGSSPARGAIQMPESVVLRDCWPLRKQELPMVNVLNSRSLLPQNRDSSWISSWGHVTKRRLHPVPLWH